MVVKSLCTGALPLALTLVVACSAGGTKHGGDRLDPDPPDSGSTANTDAGAEGPGFEVGENLSVGPLLINELSGGDEWIELVNLGPGPFDASGYVLADRNKTTGEPKLSEAVTFPPGTLIAEGGFVMVRGGGTGLDARPCPGQPPAADPPHAEDPSDGGELADADAQEPPLGSYGLCFNAEFGISNKLGETLFLFTPAGELVGKVVYPANASQGAFSYARVPHASPAAGFVTTVETPFAPNVAP